MISTRLPASPPAFDVLLLKGSILGLLLLLSSWLCASGEYLSLAIACALAYLAILYWAAARFGVFDPRVLFLGVSGLYPFTPVLDTYLWETITSMSNTSASLCSSSTAAAH